VCEPDSIKLQRGFNTKELFEPETKTLIRFDIRRCSECGNYFTYRGASECSRCPIEEEEGLKLSFQQKYWLKGFFSKNLREVRLLEEPGKEGI